MKLSFLKKAIFSGLIVAGILAGSLVATLPAFAATETMSLTPATQSVANGATSITVNIVCNTTAATRGWGAEIDFNAAALQVTNVSYGSTFYTSTYGTPFNNGQTVNNTTGKITGLAQTLLGGTGGPSGVGTLATITFSAVTPGGNNLLDSITLNPTASGLADASGNALNPTLSNATITVGTPPVVDYAVESPATAAVTGTPSQFNVTFTVKNTGALNATGSTTATITPPTGDGSAQTVTIPSLNAGATSAALQNATPFTLTGTNENVTIQINALSGDVDAADKTATVNYFYQAPSNNPTGVNGTILGTLTFTQPPTINFGTFTLGLNTVASSMNVLTNQDWQVTVAGTAPAAVGGGDSGFLTKFNPTPSINAYVPQVTLHDPLFLNPGGGNLTPDPDPSDTNIPVNNNVTLSGTAQLLSVGVAQDQNSDGVSGETRTINFEQTIVGSDAALASPFIYHNVVAFVCSTTTY